MFEIIIFVICSMVSGIVAGAFGLGGGAILVPMLIFLLPMFGVDGSIIHIAIATSLSCIIFTAISSSRSHYKRGGVDLSILKTWAPLNFIAATAGAFWTTGVDGNVIRTVYVFVMIILCVYKFFNPGKVLFSKDNIHRFGLIFPSIFGWISACIGIGGGNNVIALNLHGIDVKKAIGTSAVLGLFVSIPSVAVYIYEGINANITGSYNIGYVNWLVVLAVIPITTLSAPIGVKLAYKIDSKTLTRLWCVLSLSLSMYMIKGLL